MTFVSFVRLWRIPVAAAGVVVAFVAVWVAGDRALFIPSADGPRFVRQLAVAWLPVLLGACLIDPTPEISATLPRTEAVHRWLRIAVLAGSVVPLLPWATGLGTARQLYDLFQLGVLISVSTVAATRWGATGVLSAALVSLVLLLAGDSIGAQLGFLTFHSPQPPTLPSPLAWGLTILSSATALLLALFMVPMPLAGSWKC